MVREHLADMVEKGLVNPTGLISHGRGEAFDYLMGERPLDASLKAEKYIIQGCASTMYLVPKFESGVIHFEMDVEGGTTNPLISRGLGALALLVYNDMPPKEILSVNAAFFQEIGLNVGLSPTRSNGFASLIKQIYLYARVFDAISKT